ncbi:cold, circadian rhythm, and RNA binding 1 [Actinidia rufa]|uniref:Cold, circadian rhythm, and RNA binding 1 n=1 Tax=Actinidia rufa TaxID=165716 RepID=A0A7J0DJD4_9ERIC|nr:cold, circadian rhythm, and RNA binding 1 [Actinidia rufa]
MATADHSLTTSTTLHTETDEVQIRVRRRDAVQRHSPRSSRAQILTLSRSSMRREIPSEARRGTTQPVGFKRVTGTPFGDVGGSRKANRSLNRRRLDLGWLRRRSDTSDTLDRVDTGTTSEMASPRNSGLRKWSSDASSEGSPRPPTTNLSRGPSLSSVKSSNRRSSTTAKLADLVGLAS